MSQAVLYAMAESSTLQIFDPRKYLESFCSYLNKKPGEEPEAIEFILIKLHVVSQATPFNPCGKEAGIEGCGLRDE